MQGTEKKFQEIVKEVFTDSTCNALEESFKKLDGEIKNLEDINFLIETGNFYDSLVFSLKLWIYNFRDKYLFDVFVRCLNLLDDKTKGEKFFDVILKLDPSGLAENYKELYIKGRGNISKRNVKNNLVLAFCTEYDFLNIEPFIASCLRCIPDVQIIFITGDKSETFQLLCERRNIKIVHISNFENFGYHIFSERFFMYKKLLEYNYKKYSNILITGAKEVFFQGNPFSVERDAEVIFSAEDEVIEKSDINAMWIKDFFGSKIYEEICHNTIACSGVTMGNSSAMMTYINDVCYHLKSNNHDIKLPFDQGVHNYLGWKAHRGLYKVDLNDTIFNTVGLTPNHRISIRDDLVLIDQKFSPVINQWDRHANICEFVKKSEKFRVF